MIDTVMTSQALPAEVRQVLLRIARLQFVMAPEARNRGKLPQLAWVAIHTPERAADGHGRVGPQREPGAIVRVVRDLSQGEGGLGSPMLRVAIAAIPRFGETGVEAGDDRQLGGHLLMAGQAAVTHPIAIPEGGVTLVALVTEIGMGAAPPAAVEGGAFSPSMCRRRPKAACLWVRTGRACRSNPRPRRQVCSRSRIS